MAVNLKGRSFLTLMDFTPQEVRYLLDLSHDLKTKKRQGVFNYLLKGQEHRAALREGFHAHAVRLRSGPRWKRAPT